VVQLAVSGGKTFVRTSDWNFRTSALECISHVVYCLLFIDHTHYHELNYLTCFISTYGVWL
jgi:hypothetical protein